MMKKLKVAALDLDGVLLKDTFSPVIRSLIEAEGFAYTRDVERSVFSRPRAHSAAYLIQKFELKLTPQDIATRYFAAREDYVRKHGGGPMEGVRDFLDRLRGLGLQLVSYGGLDRDYFRREMREYLSFFPEDRDYFCTDAVRPGITEIASWVRRPRDEIVFIDDVAWFAEQAKALSVPFIGLPSSESFSFQRRDMLSLPVKCLVSSLGEITADLLRRVDDDAARGACW